MCLCNLSSLDSEIQTADFGAHANNLHSTRLCCQVTTRKSMLLNQKSNINCFPSQVTLEEVWTGMFESWGKWALCLSPWRCHQVLPMSHCKLCSPEGQDKQLVQDTWFSFGSNSQKSSKKSRGSIVEKNEKVLLWKVEGKRVAPVKEAAAENGWPLLME